MNGLMIKALAFAAILIIATIFVVMSLDIDIFADSINALTMGGAIAIAVITAAVSVKYINQMKTDTASGELVDTNWDGIGEYQNQLPSGWAYSWLATAIWAMWYMTVGYPVNGYSQIGEYNEEVKAYHEKFEAKIEHKDAKTFLFTNANGEKTVRNYADMGESIFFVQCAPCHGTTGDGLSGRAHDFSSRMSKAQILATIKNGSNQLGYSMGAMPPMMAQGADAEAIATYIADGMKGEQPASFAACGSCHGADGKGMNGMSPNLAGYDATLIHNILQNGKKGSLGTMPSFKTMITPVQEKALTVYIQSLAK